jgi:hypothetical protein
MVMPLRFTQFFENKGVPITATQDTTVVDSLRLRIAELESAVATEQRKAQEVLAIDRSAFNETNASVEPLATYKQVRYLAHFTEYTWGELRTLTKREASKKISELTGSL